MAVDVGISVKLIFLPAHRKDELRKIWHLKHLWIASSSEGLWIRGFEGDDAQEARKLIDSTVYESKGGFLFLPGNTVPERSEVKGLLWSEIQKLIRLELPSFNENLFEVNGGIDAHIIPVFEEHVVAASIVNLEDLHDYVNQTSSYTFDSFEWCLLYGNQCFILCNEALPIVSNRFWKYQSLLMPNGYDFSSELTRSIYSSMLQKKSDHFFVFDSSGSYFEVPKEKMMQLTRSSVKLTKAKVQANS